jgi:hypothetical protein
MTERRDPWGRVPGWGFGYDEVVPGDRSRLFVDIVERQPQRPLLWHVMVGDKSAPYGKPLPTTKWLLVNHFLFYSASVIREGLPYTSSAHGHVE